MGLQEWKEVVGFATGVVTVAQMFSGVFLCRTIREKGTTEMTSPMPFIGGITLSLLFLEHSRLIQDVAVAVPNGVGLLLNTGYLIFYYAMSKQEQQENVRRLSTKAALLVLALLMYTRWERPELVEFRFGSMVTILLLLLIAAPLLSLPEIMRSKSTEGLPFPMILSGFVVSLHWLLYSIIIDNTVMLIQNLITSGLCGVQLLLFLIYPSKPVELKKD